MDKSSTGGTYVCQCKANFYGLNCGFEVTSTICNSADQNVTACSLWKSLGYCSFTYSFNLIPVPIYCPQSCSLCSSLSTCVDSQDNCQLWASLNLCNTVNNVDPNLCKKSCGGCVVVGRNIPPVTRNSTTTSTRTSLSSSA